MFTEKKGFGDGDVYLGSRLPSRNIEITAQVRNRKDNSILRRSALSFFNPKNTYTIYVTYQGNTKHIDAKLNGCKCPANNIYKPVELTVGFYCPDTFWKSEEKNALMATVNGGFKFPYVSLVDVGEIGGVYNISKILKVENYGDVGTYFKAVIKIYGDVTNPKIISGDKYVRIIGSFEIGDEIEIDFVNMKIIKNGQNILGQIDRSSNFTEISLAVGTTSISYAADSGADNIDVTIYYNELYLGV